MTDKDIAIEDGSVMADENLGRPTRVEWIDSGLAINEWTDIRDIPSNVAEVETVGFWIGENANVVMVGGTRGFDNQHWLNIQLIWKSAITKQVWL